MLPACLTHSLTLPVLSGVSGSDRDACYHPSFVKGNRSLCKYIRRDQHKGTGPRKPSRPDDQPNFYAPSDQVRCVPTLPIVCRRSLSFPHNRGRATAAMTPQGSRSFSTTKANAPDMLASELRRLVSSASDQDTDPSRAVVEPEGVVGLWSQPPHPSRSDPSSLFSALRWSVSFPSYGSSPLDDPGFVADWLRSAPAQPHPRTSGHPAFNCAARVSLATFVQGAPPHGRDGEIGSPDLHDMDGSRKRRRRG